MAAPVDPRLEPPQPCGFGDCLNLTDILFKVSDAQDAWICSDCIPMVLREKARIKDQVYEVGSAPREDLGRPEMEQQEPFHGDPHLQELVRLLIPETVLFVETGAGAGDSLKWVAEQYPSLLCWSCEAHGPTYKQAQRYTVALSNVHILNGLSTELFTMFETKMPGLITRRAFFWLDAHSHGFGCTLREEVATIIRLWRGGYILIDDFEVVGRPEFAYDLHEDISIGWEFIKSSVDRERFRGLWGPNYKARTEDRGWGLLAFGDLVDGAVDRLNNMEF